MLAPSHKLIVWSLTQWLIYTTAIVVQSLSLVRLCDPMDCNTPGFPDLPCLPEFAQTHVHWGADAIHPSHPLIIGELQIQKKNVSLMSIVCSGTTPSYPKSINLSAYSPSKQAAGTYLALTVSKGMR